MTKSAGPALTRLHAEFGDRVQFMTLYVREAHPGERVPQPRTFEEKLEHARAYVERDRIPWPVVVDDLEGRLHRTLDPKPNSAYFVDERGTVVGRTLWSNDVRGVRRGLVALVRGEQAGERTDTARPAPGWYELHVPWCKSELRLDATEGEACIGRPRRCHELDDVGELQAEVDTAAPGESLRLAEAPSGSGQHRAMLRSEPRSPMEGLPAAASAGRALGQSAHGQAACRPVNRDTLSTEYLRTLPRTKALSASSWP